MSCRLAGYNPRQVVVDNIRQTITLHKNDQPYELSVRFREQLHEAYTPAQLALGTGGPKVPELLMTLDNRRDELCGLEFIVAREIERDVTEGGLLSNIIH